MKKSTKLMVIVGGMVLVVGVGKTLSKILTPKEYTVVVLGSHQRADALVRVEGAKWVANNFRVKKMIFTGGKLNPALDWKTEADFMADEMGAIVPYPVLRETFSSSTAGNIKRVAKVLLPGERVIVVSNHHHVRSAAWCLEHVYGHPSLFVYYPGYGWEGEGYKRVGSVKNQMALPTEQSQNLCERAGCC